MIVVALPSLVSAAITFALGLSVFFHNRKSPLNRTFLLLCIALSWWAFSEFMLVQSTTPDSAYFWLKLTAFWTLTPPLLLLFILVFTGKGNIKKEWWVLPFLFAPAALFCSTELFTSLITVVPAQMPWGYTYGYAADPLLFFIEMAWTILTVVLALALCIHFSVKTAKRQERLQASYMAAGISIILCGGVIVQIILPAFQIVVPVNPTLFFLCLAVLVGYAIWKHELFIVSPATTAETIVATMPDALLLLDERETIRVANKAARDLIGRGDDLIGRPVQALFPGEAEKNAVFEKLRAEGIVRDMETSFLSASGRIVPVTFSASVIRDSDGTILSLVCTATDITLRKQARQELIAKQEELQRAYQQITADEEELRQNYDELAKSEQLIRESEERYRAVFENTGTAMLILEEDTTISLANSEFELLSGYTRAELEGKISWTIFTVPEFRQMMVDQHRLRRREPEKAMRRYMAPFLTRSGEIRTILLDVGMIPGTTKSVVGLADITNWRKAEEALQRATKKLNVLNTITFSEIQNAVFTLSGYLELEATDIRDEKLLQMVQRQRAIVQKITYALKSATLFQNLGLRPPQWQDVNTAFLYGISHLDLADIKKKVGLSGVEIYADPLIENVFFVLAQNTLVHGKTATEITAGYRETAEGLVITFSDNGTGIPESAKESIFERADDRSQNPGLFLAREILGITGISITETGTPGSGARFEILVPRGGYRFPAAGDRDTPAP